MPAGPPFWINGQLRAFISPVAEFLAWPGAPGDIDVGRPAICHPTRPGERQRRTFDAPSQQPITEIVVYPPQPIEVNVALIKPYDLDRQVKAGGSMSRKQALVHHCEPIVQPLFRFGCAAAEGCPCATYPGWTSTCGHGGRIDGDRRYRRELLSRTTSTENSADRRFR